MLETVEMTGSLDPSVYLPSVVNSCMNTCWEQLAFGLVWVVALQVLPVKLSYRGEALRPATRRLFLKVLLFIPVCAPKCRYSSSSFMQGQMWECLVRFLLTPQFLYLTQFCSL